MPKPHDAIPDVLLEQVALRFRALSSLSRLKILNALMDGPRAMGEVLAATGLEQSNLSRHVRELERAGCVARERSGRAVRLTIADPTLRDLCELVCGALVDQATATHRRLTRG